jgi:hypothetical protein
LGFKKVKSVSFTGIDNDILSFASAKRNFSEYVKDLIRRDMNGNSFQLTVEMKRAIKEFIESNYALASVKNENVKGSKVDTEIISAIDNLMNFSLKDI